MKIEELKKILENKKFNNENAQIKFIQDFDGFSIFDIEVNKSRDLSGKLTSEIIEFYGIDGDKFFDTSEEGLEKFFKQVLYEIQNGYRIHFLDENNQLVLKSLFTDEEKVEKNSARDICEQILNQNPQIISAHFENLLNNISYNFSFKKNSNEILK